MDDHYDYTTHDSQLQHRRLPLPNLLQSKRVNFIYGPIQKYTATKDEEHDDEEKFNTLSKHLFNRVKERLFRKSSSPLNEEEYTNEFVKSPVWADILYSSTQYKPFHQFVYKKNIILAVNNVNSQGYSVLIYQIEKLQNTSQYSLAKKIDNQFENTPSKILNTFGSGSCSLFL